MSDEKIISAKWFQRMKTNGQNSGLTPATRQLVLAEAFPQQIVIKTIPKHQTTYQLDIMIKIALVSIWIAIVGVSQCMAQSNDSQTITNWGQSVRGVQLGITMTNNIFQVGSLSAVESVITNSSTNAITVDISAPTVNFDVLLISDTGKLYHITTPLKIRELSIPVVINPGEEKSESIPVTFGETRFGDTVEPGDYTLKATRKFSSNNGDFTLVSNSIKVTIVK